MHSYRTGTPLYYEYSYSQPLGRKEEINLGKKGEKKDKSGPDIDDSINKKDFLRTMTAFFRLLQALNKFHARDKTNAFLIRMHSYSYRVYSSSSEFEAPVFPNFL